MKRIIAIILALLLCAAAVPSAFAEEGVSISLSADRLVIGTGNKLPLEVSTESTEKLKYTWESSDKKIASVDGKGNVSGAAEGEATITCSAVLGKEVVATAACNVTVFTSVKSVKAASPVKGNILFVNQPVQIGTTVTPENATYPKLVWTSSDETIATVDENGFVTGHMPGKVKITCATDQPNQAKAITADTQFTVKQQVETIELDAAVLVFWEKDVIPDQPDTAEVALEILPENADNRKVKWETSDKNVAEVKNGTIKAKKAGYSVVSVTAEDGGGTSANCEVFVLDAFTYKISARAENADIAFTPDPGKATETACRILKTAMDRLTETENTYRTALLGYFARAAAANGKVFLAGSADDADFPVSLIMPDDRGNCAMLAYDPAWGSIYFSTAQGYTLELAQAQVDPAVFGEVIPAPAPAEE